MWIKRFLWAFAISIILGHSANKTSYFTLYAINASPWRIYNTPLWITGCAQCVPVPKVTPKLLTNSNLSGFGFTRFIVPLSL